MEIESDDKSVDRWTCKPGLLALGTVAALSLVCQIPGTLSFIMIPVTFLGFAIGSIAILGATIYLLIKKRPRRGASIFLVLLLPVLLWRPIVWATEVIHVGLTVCLGVGQIGVEAQSNDFGAYDWSVGFAGGPTILLIHDVSDEIALPAAQHTKPLSDEGGFGEECAGKVDHLIKHYYVCTI